jgi:threonine dehydrogenase-like Zn-dependent dehydrogenase
MKAKHIVFIGPWQAELQEFDFDDTPDPQDVIIEMTHSLISPGTELACMSGRESWAPLPMGPGYAGCGRVRAVGDAIEGIKEGDRVFSYTKHASFDKGRVVVLPLPDSLDAGKACFARMAAVSMTALRVSEAELGDYVAVYGLGLVGNLAAQLFTLAGCEVIGIDLSPKRCELARDCGVKHVLNPADMNAKEAVAAITGGEMCQTVVEAIGLSPVALEASVLARPLGEVILLGSPRGAHQVDVTPWLNQIHLWPNGCVTYKGAHEWRYPTKHDPSHHIKHSIERNIRILLQAIADDRLKVNPLLTHVMAPDQCQAAYFGLRDDREHYLGVVFEW